LKLPRQCAAATRAQRSGTSCKSASMIDGRRGRCNPMEPIGRSIAHHLHRKIRALLVFTRDWRRTTLTAQRYKRKRGAASKFYFGAAGCGSCGLGASGFGASGFGAGVATTATFSTPVPPVPKPVLKWFTPS